MPGLLALLLIVLLVGLLRPAYSNSSLDHEPQQSLVATTLKELKYTAASHRGHKFVVVPEGQDWHNAKYRISFAATGAVTDHSARVHFRIVSLAHSDSIMRPAQEVQVRLWIRERASNDVETAHQASELEWRHVDVLQPSVDHPVFEEELQRRGQTSLQGREDEKDRAAHAVTKRREKNVAVSDADGMVLAVATGLLPSTPYEVGVTIITDTGAAVGGRIIDGSLEAKSGGFNSEIRIGDQSGAATQVVKVGNGASLEEIPVMRLLSFRTFPPQGQACRFRFGFSSCLLPRDLKPGKSVFRDGHLEDVDFFLFLGDTIYSDNPQPGADAYYRESHYMERFREILEHPEMQFFLRKKPTFSIWDDHEFVNDYDQGSGTDIYANARRGFDVWMSQRNPHVYRAHQSDEVRPPLYFNFSVCDASFFVLDTRSYRSRSRDMTDNTPSKSILGEIQLERLIAWLRDDPARVKFIASSVMVNQAASHAYIGDNQYLEGWFRFSYERTRVLDAIQTETHVRTEAVHFVSADSHWPIVADLTSLSKSRVRRRFDIMEVSASPLAAFALTPSNFSGPDILYTGDGRGISPLSLYATIDVDSTHRPARLYSAIREWRESTQHGSEWFGLFLPAPRFPPNYTSVFLALLVTSVWILMCSCWRRKRIVPGPRVSLTETHNQ